MVALPLIDVTLGLRGVEMLVVHAAEDLGCVAGSPDAALPVACVQALTYVGEGEVPDHGAVIAGGCSLGRLRDEGGGLLPWGKDLVPRCRPECRAVPVLRAISGCAG
jgi:hypothetical protein